MILKDAQIGRTYTVETVHLPFQLERRLEALGMTRRTCDIGCCIGGLFHLVIAAYCETTEKESGKV